MTIVADIVRKSPKWDAYLGRTLYGNLCGFALNYDGRAKLRAARGRLASDVAEAIAAIDRDGFYRLPELLPAEIMQPVVAAYQAALDDPNLAVDVASTAGRLAGLTTLCRTVGFNALPALEALVTPQIQRIVDAFYGGKQRVYLAGARRTWPIPVVDIDVYSNSWHCDNEPADRIKVFVALSDISNDCGPTHLLGRRRTREILRAGFRNRDDYGVPTNVLEDPRGLELFTGPIGSVLFINVTQCLHRAGVPAAGLHRDVAEIQYSLE